MTSRLLALLSVPLLASCGGSTESSRGVSREETLLSVSAAGHAESRPDKAEFQAGIETWARSAQEASAANGKPVVVFGAGALLVRAFGTPDEARSTVPLSLPDDGRTYVADVAVYDSDADGRDDLLVQYSDLDADQSRQRPELLLSDGAGGFSAGIVEGDDTRWGRGYDALPLDFDGDVITRHDRRQPRRRSAASGGRGSQLPSTRGP